MNKSLIEDIDVKIEYVAIAIGDIERESLHTYSWDRTNEDFRELCRYHALIAINAIDEYERKL